MGQCKSVVEILPATTKILTEQAKVCFELFAGTLQRLIGKTLNPLMRGGNKKVTHTAASLSMRNLFVMARH